MKQDLQRFGGDWTAEKLERVRKYLAAYATIMHKQNFRFAYIDAFAGTGYRTLKQAKGQSLPSKSHKDSLMDRRESHSVWLLGSIDISSSRGIQTVSPNWIG